MNIPSNSPYRYQNCKLLLTMEIKRQDSNLFDNLRRGSSANETALEKTFSDTDYDRLQQVHLEQIESSKLNYFTLRFKDPELEQSFISYYYGNYRGIILGNIYTLLITILVLLVAILQVDVTKIVFCAFTLIISSISIIIACVKKFAKKTWFLELTACGTLCLCIITTAISEMSNFVNSPTLPTSTVAGLICGKRMDYLLIFVVVYIMRLRVFCLYFINIIWIIGYIAIGIGYNIRVFRKRITINNIPITYYHRIAMCYLVFFASIFIITLQMYISELTFRKIHIGQANLNKQQDGMY